MGVRVRHVPGVLAELPRGLPRHVLVVLLAALGALLRAWAWRWLGWGAVSLAVLLGLLADPLSVPGIATGRALAYAGVANDGDDLHGRVSAIPGVTARADRSAPAWSPPPWEDLLVGNAPSDLDDESCAQRLAPPPAAHGRPGPV